SCSPTIKTPPFPWKFVPFSVWKERRAQTRGGVVFSAWGTAIDICSLLGKLTVTPSVEDVVREGAIGAMKDEDNSILPASSQETIPALATDHAGSNAGLKRLPNAGVGDVPGFRNHAKRRKTESTMNERSTPSWVQTRTQLKRQKYSAKKAPVGDTLRERHISNAKFTLHRCDHNDWIPSNGCYTGLNHPKPKMVDHPLYIPSVPG
ncbi:hypothetical protein BD410DRAFT_810741, partial [Rickenella mellea]